MCAIADRLAPGTEGTCVHIAGDIWAVRGSRGWHRCNALRGACSCEDYLYRQARVAGQCRHLRALAAYLLTAEVVRAEFAFEESAVGRTMTNRDVDLREIFR